MSIHFTKEFEAFALLLMREMPVSRAAELMGETDTRLWRLLFRQVDAAYAEADFSQVCCVGVDEMCVCARGGSRSVSLPTWCANGSCSPPRARTGKPWLSFIEALEKHNGDRRAITQASMDMSKAYQAGVADYCRNAQVVFDKFHVILNANKAVDQVRFAERRVGGPGVRDALRWSQWLWRKNPENLTEKQQAHLAGIQGKNLCTAKAYQMRLVLQDIYRSAHVATARHRFKVGCRWVRWTARFYKVGIFASMLTLAKMIEQHLDGILGYWKGGLTNAFMEGLNSVFSATMRKTRGYRSGTHLITMLYFVAGKLRLPQI